MRYTSAPSASPRREEWTGSAVADLGRWTTARERQRDEFRARAAAWAFEDGRTVVRWPRDQMLVLRLGVPCDDCVQVVHQLGPGPGRARHVVRVAGVAGEHWSDRFTAACGWPPVGPSLEWRIWQAQDRDCRLTADEAVARTEALRWAMLRA